MARTTAEDVQDLLGADYDSARSLSAFIATASSLVDRVVTCATNKGMTLTATEAELIERWLAAHFYTKSDPLYASKSNKSASGSFVQGAEPERYKAGAIEMDPSGCVKDIMSSKLARLVWLGKNTQDRTRWDQRNTG
jgi:hypothetical protein